MKTKTQQIREIVNEIISATKQEAFLHSQTLIELNFVGDSDEVTRHFNREEEIIRHATIRLESVL